MKWEEIAKRKDEFLEKRLRILRKKVSALEVKLLDKILEVFIHQVSVDDAGFILVDGANIDLVDAMDQLIEEFMDSEHRALLSRYIKDLSGVSAFNARYFGSITNLSEKVKNEAR